MATSKEKKAKILDDLREKLKEQKAVILVGITGLRVKDLSVLRKQLKGVNAKIQVVKKTLAGLVFKEKKLDFKKDQFKEELAFVFGFQDEISPAKVVHQFSLGNDRVKILAGFLENELKSREDIVFLAQLPGREELLARLVGCLSSPLSGFVRVLEGNIKGLVVALSAISKSKQ